MTIYYKTNLIFSIFRNLQNFSTSFTLYFRQIHLQFLPHPNDYIAIQHSFLAIQHFSLVHPMKHHDNHAIYASLLYLEVTYPEICKI
eukprot:UN12190